MREHEEEVGQGNPEPAALDEDLVEKVGFLGEVGGGKGWVVGLLRHYVWTGACGRIEGRIQRTDEEGRWIESQEERFHHGWDER